MTSFSELAREAREVERWNRLHPAEDRRTCYVEQCLPGSLPVVAAMDYVRAYPQLIGPYISAPFMVLGTDGFGRSDTREALRQFFEADRSHVVLTVLNALVREQAVPRDLPVKAILRYGLQPEGLSPWTR